jgi:ABC-type branched-subunit amino acid transport system ATPase component/branched-subunit amino acid ABC-type transport system permease component
MNEFLALALTGAVSGAVYSLIAAGLVLTHSTSGTFNFAFGAIAFCVAFTFFELHSGLHYPVWVSAAICLLGVGPLLGLALDLLVFRGLALADDTAKVVATIGLSIALPALAVWLSERLDSWFHLKLPSADNVVFPVGIGPSPKKTWHLSNSIILDSTQIIILASAAGIALLLWVLQKHTALGLRMRATVDRRGLAEMRGIDIGRTSTIAWMLGVTVAGFTGILAAPILALAPGSYTSIFFVAAAAAVVARLRSLPIALLAGLAIGIGQNLAVGYATFTQNVVGLGTAVPFLFLLAGLLAMSRDRSRIAGVAAASPSPPSFVDDLPPWRRRLPWAVAALLLACYTLFIADALWLGLVVTGLALGVVFLSLVVVCGIGGMVSLAQAALVTVGGLTTGLLISHGAPFLVAAIGGILAAVALGLLLALPAMRLGGLALALATLALALVSDWILFQWTRLSNGPLGWTYTRPKIGFIDLAGDRSMAVALAVVLAAVSWLMHNLRHSASGRAMLAVRSSAVAASTAGVSSVRTKLVVFGVSSAIAGLGGVLLSTVNLGLTFQSYQAPLGLTWLAAVVLFGIRRVEGAILAGLVVSLAPQLLSMVTSSTRVPDILFGLGAVALARNPDGAIADMSEKLARGRSRRRAARLPAPQPSPSATVVRERVAALGTPDSARGSAALSVRSLSARYGLVPVLHDISFTVRAGSIFALLGTNGAGKSTLCSVLSGLHRQTTGTIQVEDADVSGWGADERSRRGLVVAPESRGIFPRLTVEENVAVWVRNAAQRSEVYDRFPSLAARRKVAAGSLSGGEQQMLALAPVVVRKPVVLVADEPSLGLAPRIAGEVMQTLISLRDAGVGILIVEERPRRVLEVADEVAFLELGRITWQGLPAEISDEMLTANVLGASIAR